MSALERRDRDEVLELVEMEPIGREPRGALRGAERRAACGDGKADPACGLVEEPSELAAGLRLEATELAMPCPKRGAAPGQLCLERGERSEVASRRDACGGVGNVRIERCLLYTSDAADE